MAVSLRRDVCKDTLDLVAQHYPERWLLPNLRESRLCGTSPIRELWPLAQPSLLSLRYEVEPLLPDTWHLDLLALKAPNIKVLRIDDINKPRRGSELELSIFNDPETSKALSAAVFWFGNLTAVDFLTFLDPGAILHLSRLPRLVRLALKLGKQNCVPLDATPDDCPPFPALRSLQIRGRDATQLALWLSPLRLLSLATIWISTELPSSITAVEELFALVSQFAGLTRLKMHFADARYLANDGVLDPLLRELRGMEDFTFSGLAFNPSGNTLAAVASAWPRLRNLDFNRSCYLTPSSGRVNLADLLIFALRCPAIERIAVPLSPHMMQNPTRRENGVVRLMQASPPLPPHPSRLLVPGPSNPSVLSCVPVSPLQILHVVEAFQREDYQCIAEYLANVFPNVKLTFRCPPHQQPVLQDCVQCIMRLKENYLCRD